MFASGCSPGNGDMQWSFLERQPTAIPHAAEVRPSSLQIVSGGGRVQAAGISARLTIGSADLNGSANGISVRNLSVSWGQ
ncbi:MAG: hypothetical protein A2X94_12225 [Bdellovibrionales bacterium GWB1_55_8]|nr:MAG: hypothetical protein A2X94_12225 [Bdellovibrionales bacterium GWB1_55_8]